MSRADAKRIEETLKSCQEKSAGAETLLCAAIDSVRTGLRTTAALDSTFREEADSEPVMTHRALSPNDCTSLREFEDRLLPSQRGTEVWDIVLSFLGAVADFEVSIDGRIRVPPEGAF